MNAADEKAWRDYVENQPWNTSDEMHMKLKEMKLNQKPNELFLAGRASRNSEVEGLREALRRFTFNHLADGEEDKNNTQFVWETIYRDRVQDWIDYKDIDRARQALTKGDSDAG